MKNLKNLNGANILTKKDQKHIKGGTGVVYTPGDLFICTATADNGATSTYNIDNPADMETICLALGSSCATYSCRENDGSGSPVITG